jgi:threonine/homoserine/homoserine lactone efflux protein
MSSYWLIVAFVVINLFLDLEPASAVERVVGEGMAKGAMGAQGAILGILAADLMWCFFAISALFTVMVLVPPMLYGAKWLGLACLLWLLVRSLRFAIEGRGVHPMAPAPVSGFFASAYSGFAQQMTHPTVMIFFFAVLSVFAGSRFGWEHRMFDLGVFAVLLEWPVLALYARIGAVAARAALRPGPKTTCESISSLALLAATGIVAAPSNPR